MIHKLNYIFLTLLFSVGCLLGGNSESNIVHQVGDRFQYSIQHLVAEDKTLIQWFAEDQKDPLRMYVMVCLTELLLVDHFMSPDPLPYFSKIQCLWDTHTVLKNYKKILVNIINVLHEIDLSTLNEMTLTRIINQNDMPIMQRFDQCLSKEVMSYVSSEAGKYYERFITEVK